MTGKTKKLTTLAISTALIFVVTWLIKFPVPATNGAYVNFGDVVVFITAFVLGGPLGAVAAAFGSAFADLAVGAAVYAIPTFIIKGLMAFVVGIITTKPTFPRYLTGAVLAEIIMIAGYATFESLFFDKAYALAALPFNFIQFAGSIIVAIALFVGASRLNGHFKLRNN